MAELSDGLKRVTGDYEVGEVSGSGGYGRTTDGYTLKGIEAMFGSILKELQAEKNTLNDKITELEVRNKEVEGMLRCIHSGLEAASELLYRDEPTITIANEAPRR